MGFVVRTDYSHLTPYEPPHALHTRLHSGPLPELVPSDGYGELLPYASTSTMPDGGLREARFGFVTLGGVIVTDLVYNRIERANGGYRAYSSATPAPLPAYKLAVNIPGTEGQWGAEEKYAACALDGSWITPFEYADITFTEDVIILMRSSETFDIDVRGYDGRLLYNVKETHWASRIPQSAWPGAFAYGVSEGYASVSTGDNASFFVEMLTGRARFTGYSEVSQFSDGLAPVITGAPGQNSYLWGYIDKEFKLVVPPMYSYPAPFVNGRALVETPDGAQRVIGRRGETLFTVPDGCWIEQDYTGEGFNLHTADRGGSAKFLTNDFAAIDIPEIALDNGEYNWITRHGGGWNSIRYDGGTVLFSPEKEINLEGVAYISDIIGDVLVYSVHADGASLMGVMTLDGNDIIKPELEGYIRAVARDGTVTAIIHNSHIGGFYFGGKEPEYKSGAYRLFNAVGEEFARGPGVLAYDEDAGLYRAIGGDYFAWLDLEGNTIISIPHLSSVMD